MGLERLYLVFHWCLPFLMAILAIYFHREIHLVCSFPPLSFPAGNHSKYNFQNGCKKKKVGIEFYKYFFKLGEGSHRFISKGKNEIVRLPFQRTIFFKKKKYRKENKRKEKRRRLKTGKLPGERTQIIARGFGDKGHIVT